jgi:hypothetical protein
MDDKTKIALDGKLISLEEDYELDYWTEALGISRERLREAVAAAGHSAAAVRAWLAEQSGTEDDASG